VTKYVKELSFSKKIFKYICLDKLLLKHSENIMHTPSIQPHSEQEPFGFYSSDPRSINIFLDNYIFDMSHILEPSAGSGTLTKELLSRDPNAHIDQIEIQPHLIPELERLNCGDVYCQDFLNYKPSLDSRPFTAIIMNPDYKHGLVQLEHALKIANGMYPVIAHINLSFFESKLRYQFHQDNPVSKLFILHRRPHFKKGTFRSPSPFPSCFAVWNDDTQGQTIQVI